MSSVAEHLGTSVPTASRIVAGLVGRGLLARQSRGTDRRRVNLVVTSKGRDALANARAGTLTRLESELASLSAHDRGVVVEAMGLLRNVFAPLVVVRPPGATLDDIARSRRSTTTTKEVRRAG